MITVFQVSESAGAAQVGPVEAYTGGQRPGLQGRVYGGAKAVISMQFVADAQDGAASEAWRFRPHSDAVRRVR